MGPLLGKYLVIAGIIIIITGLLVIVFHDKAGWLGKLPGDIRIERENFSFYFPITTMILVSVVVSLVIWLVKKYF